MNALSTTRAILARVFGAVSHLSAWTLGSWRLLAACVVLGNLLILTGRSIAGYAVIWCVPAFSLVRAVWHAVHPLTCEAVLGGPIRRHGWRRRLRRKLETHRGPLRPDNATPGGTNDL